MQKSRRSASPNRCADRQPERAEMLTIREPIKAWHCTWGRLGHSRALLSERCSRSTRPREVDAMGTRRLSTVVSPGASTLVLLVLALAACGSSLTKSDDGGVSVGREPAGVDSQAGSGPDLAQSSEGAASITEDPAALGDFGRKVVKTASLGLRSEDVRQERRAGAAARRRRWHCTKLAGLQATTPLRRISYSRSPRGVREGGR